MNMNIKGFELPAQTVVTSPYSTALGAELRDRAAVIVPLLREHALEGERLGALAPASLNALNDLGAFKLTLPTDFGGYALGARDVVDIVAELSRGDGAAGWMAFVAGGLRNMLALPDKAVREILADGGDWVGPLAAGASVFATKVGSARRVDGGWMVSGSWHFGSGCKHAKWMGVGVDYIKESGEPGRAMVVLERRQVDIIDNWHVMGMKATSSNSMTVRQEEFVPEHRFMDLGEFPARMDETRKRYQGTANKFNGTGQMLLTNLTNVAIILGMARGALENYIDMACKQRPFNLPYPRVAEMASVQICAAKAYAAVKMAEATIYGCADQLDFHAFNDLDVPPELEPAMVMQTAYAANTLDEAVGSLQLSIGSATAYETNPLQRFVRDIRVALLHGAVRLDPTAEIYGRHLMGLEPFPMFAGGLPDRAKRDG